MGKDPGIYGIAENSAALKNFSISLMLKGCFKKTSLDELFVDLESK